MDWAEFCALHIPAAATISVQAYQGSGAYGDVYAAPVAVTPCVVEDTRRWVPVQTQDAAGAQRLSSTTVYCPPGTVSPEGSLVTIGDRTARVIAAAYLDAHGLPLPSHLELSLE